MGWYGWPWVGRQLELWVQSSTGWYAMLTEGAFGLVGARMLTHSDSWWSMACTYSGGIGYSFSMLKVTHIGWEGTLSPRWPEGVMAESRLQRLQLGALHRC